tara:strand:+ start:863 stop:1108 length:246 start_codon:yes stop_codon:yes gene_type:complete
MSEPTLEPKFKAFKDGVYDAIIYGRMNELEIQKDIVSHHNEETKRKLLDHTDINNGLHYYKRGYDFGLIIHSDLEDKENDD